MQFVELPETRYARSGDVSIAYQVTGDDLVAGSGIQFRERGAAELGGAGEWRLFAVETA